MMTKCYGIVSLQFSATAWDYQRRKTCVTEVTTIQACKHHKDTVRKKGVLARSQNTILAKAPDSTRIVDW